MSKKDAINFINKYRTYFGSAEASFGVPAQVLLAMSAIETGWGTSEFFKNTNNMFGLKAKTPYDNASTIISPEYEKKRKIYKASEFKKYNSFIESIYDTCLRISNNAIYKEPYNFFNKYLVTHRKVYLNEGIDLLAVKWATDPNYGDKIKNILKRDYVRELMKW